MLDDFYWWCVNKPTYIFNRLEFTFASFGAAKVAV